VPEPARDLDEQLKSFGRDLPGAAVLDRDAARLEARCCVFFECASDLVVPAETLEIGVLQADSFPARTDEAGLAGPGVR
jgi:hypothetical protein